MNLKDAEKIRGDVESSNFERKMSVIKEGSNILSSIKSVVLLVLFGFVLISLLQFPYALAILIGVEVAINLASSLIRMNKLKSGYESDEENGPESYRKIILSSERYNLIKSITALAIDSVSAVLVFAFFSGEIIGFRLNIAGEIIQGFSLKYLIFVFAAYRIFEAFMRIIRYRQIKEIFPSEELSEVNYQFVLFSRKLDILNLLPAAGVFLIAVISYPFPLFIMLGLLGIILLGVALALTEFYRVRENQEHARY